MSQAANPKPKIERKQWRIPADLDRLIKLDGVAKDERPSSVVVRRLRESFQRDPVRITA